MATLEKIYANLHNECVNFDATTAPLFKDGYKNVIRSSREGKEKKILSFKRFFTRAGTLGS